jgi:hypothetical protein
MEVMPGHLGDVRGVVALIGAVPRGRCLTADAPYDSDGLQNRSFIDLKTLPA